MTLGARDSAQNTAAPRIGWETRRAAAAWTAALVIAVWGGSSCSGGGGAMPDPTPTLANVAGNWRGSVSFTAGGVAAEEPFEMTLVQQQDRAEVTGTYSAGRFSGNLRGETTVTSFTGTFDFNSNAQGQICTGTFTVSGPAVGNSLTWTSPNVVGASCTNTPINMVFEVQRR